MSHSIGYANGGEGSSTIVGGSGPGVSLFTDSHEGEGLGVVDGGGPGISLFTDRHEGVRLGVVGGGSRGVSLFADNPEREGLSVMGGGGSGVSPSRENEDKGLGGDSGSSDVLPDTNEEIVQGIIDQLQALPNGDNLLKGIAKDVRKKLADHMIRWPRGSNRFNAFVAAEHQNLPRAQQAFGINTQKLAGQWARMTEMEKKEYEHTAKLKNIRSAHQIRHRQLRDNVRRIKDSAAELVKLGGMEFVILLSDTRLAEQMQQNLSYKAGSVPCGVKFLNAMKDRKFGAKGFDLYCSTVENTNNPGSASAPESRKLIDDLNRNEKRSRFSNGLRSLWNAFHPNSTKLTRLPAVPWDNLLRKLELMFVLPEGYTMDDIYNATPQKANPTSKLLALLKELEDGKILLIQQQSAMGDNSA